MHNSGYLMRLLLLLAIVVIGTILMLVSGSPNDASEAISTSWFWLWAVADMAQWHFSLRLPLVVALTALTVGIAAQSRKLTTAVAVWLVLNFMGALWFLSVYDGHD